MGGRKAWGQPQLKKSLKTNPCFMGHLPLGQGW